SGLNPQQPTPHQQMIAGYYDQGNGYWSAQYELSQASGIPGVTGLMYTTWMDDYSQMAQFAAAAKAAWPYYVASLAPSKGNITGTVTNTAGQVIPGATVSLSNGTLSWTTTTDGAGTFSFTNIPSGSYTLQISGFGYNGYLNSTVQVPDGSSTGGGSSTNTAGGNTVSLAVALSQPATFPTIRIKSGGAAMTDEQGNSWLADTNYDSGAGTSTTDGISNTPTPSLYGSQHYNTGGFTYNFAVPNGNYYLTLKFAEFYASGPRQRLFNVLVNGKMVDQNLDIFTAAGGKDRAYDLRLPVVVTGQWITIQFQAVADNPIVNAIEIEAGDSSFILPGNLTGQVLNYEGQPAPGATVSLRLGSNTLTTTADGAGNYSFWNLIAGTYSLQAVGFGYPPSISTAVPILAGQTASAQLTLPQPPTALPIRIKCGGASLTDEQGNVWSSDFGLYDYGASGGTSNNISNTNTPSVYQTERWMSAPMRYHIPAPNGTYNLVLKFAELYWWSSGQRVFNIVVNGTQVTQNLDVVAAAGGAFTAYDLTVPVAVTNQWVTIEFDPVVNNPKINAIELDPVQVGPSTLSGKIQNIAQQGVSGATIVVTSNSYRRSAVSDAAGSYSIQNLPSGTYTVQVAATGYLPSTSWSVVVKPVTSITANLQLTAADPSFSPLRVNCGGPALTD
ncbi:MAG TPA: malectin domain-containing carbohydrate-binding protein, partial [Bryobacteraceae bacterium]